MLYDIMKLSREQIITRGGNFDQYSGPQGDSRCATVFRSSDTSSHNVVARLFGLSDVPGLVVYVPRSV